MKNLRLKKYIENLLDLVIQECNIYEIKWYIATTDKGNLEASYIGRPYWEKFHAYNKFPYYKGDGIYLYLGSKNIYLEDKPMTLTLALGIISKKLELKGKLNYNDDEDDMQRIRELCSKINNKRKENRVNNRIPLYSLYLGGGLR